MFSMPSTEFLGVSTSTSADLGPRVVASMLVAVASKPLSLLKRDVFYIRACGSTWMRSVRDREMKAVYRVARTASRQTCSSGSAEARISTTAAREAQSSRTCGVRSTNRVRTTSSTSALGVLMQ